VDVFGAFDACEEFKPPASGVLLLDCLEQLGSDASVLMLWADD
jgi:hypothetical protein